MRTRRLSTEQLDEAAAILRAGGLVAFPTETVYGLGARGLDEDCVARIFAAKGRPADNPVILHVPSLDAAWPLWSLDGGARARIAALATAFWPGPLTLVAPKSPLVPARATAGSANVAVRVPAHDVARALLAKVGEPLAAPSANASTRPSPTTAAHVLASLDGRIDAVVDGGPCARGLESTVVDAARGLVLRPGALSLAALRSVDGAMVARAPGAPAHVDDASPGLRHRHYAPAIAEVRLVDDVSSWWTSDAAILCRAATALRRGARAAPTEALPDDEDGYARALYAALYRIEAAAPRALVVEDVPAAWTAVRDRLLRATSS